MKLYISKELRVSLITLAYTLISWGVNAQTARSTYFLDNSFHRLELNPALQPTRGYINFGLGNTAFDLSTGNLSLGKLIYFQEDGTPDWVLNDPSRRRGFLNSLSDKNPIGTSLSLQPFGFGFYTHKIFWNFNVSFRNQTNIIFPKSLFEMVVNGSGTYSMKDFYFDQISYGEIGLGASFPIGEKLTVGTKLKYLVGLAYMQGKFNKFNMQMNDNKWDIAVDGLIKSSINNGYQTPVGEDFDFGDYFDDMSSIANKINNKGMAIDLGATYKLLDNLTLSLGITDLGYINWKKDNNTFIQIDDYQANLLDINKNLEDLKDDIDNLPELHATSITPSDIKTGLASKVNMGAEYSVVNDKISFGLLFSKQTGKSPFTSTTFSTNLKPLRAFNTALTFTTASHKINAFGAAINWTPGWFFNMFAATDFIFSKVTPEYIPVNARQANFQFGITIPFGSKEKSKSKSKKIPEIPVSTPAVTDSAEFVPTDSIPVTIIDSLTTLPVVDSLQTITPDTFGIDSLQISDSIMIDSIQNMDSIEIITNDSIEMQQPEKPIDNILPPVNENEKQPVENNNQAKDIIKNEE